ncbi:MAG: DEAD/DEAH box helicase [Candidatus Staskawiczbacteria bacterium]|nr:DEAD/DEAH box helicase [Candidatus Staskawiczbacteria bacterium]
MDKQTDTQINEVPVKAGTEPTFSGLGIAPQLLDAISGLGFKIPTSIQHKAITPAIEGKDIIGIAQTGTGKTLAFGIPLVQQILKAGKGKGLIILPTRELALQVEETIRKIGRTFGVKTAVLIGGASMYTQVHALRGNPHVVIGTPGRIIDHIQQRTLNLSDVSVLVLDEADRMFDMGFAPQIKKILDVVPKNRQTLLFSATMPDGIVKIATQHMKLPVRVEIARPGTTAENVEHELFVVKREQRLPLLKKLLGDYKGSVLVFVRVKHGARKICDNLKAIGVSAAEIHSNRSLNQRKEALEGFKTGRFRVLVATDIAQRGIDVKNIELVINFDLPEAAEDYVHRIGRTGRAGMSGKAISFAMPEQGQMIREIERLTRVYLPISKLPDLTSFTSKQVGASETYKDNYPPRRGNRPSSNRFGHAKRRY